MTLEDIASELDRIERELFDDAITATSVNAARARVMLPEVRQAQEAIARALYRAERIA
jgi:hypothetical protein